MPTNMLRVARKLQNRPAVHIRRFFGIGGVSWRIDALPLGDPRLSQMEHISHMFDALFSRVLCDLDLVEFQCHEALQIRCTDILLNTGRAVLQPIWGMILGSVVVTHLNNCSLGILLPSEIAWLLHNLGEIGEGEGDLNKSSLSALLLS